MAPDLLPAYPGLPKRSRVSPWASSTHVTATNPGAPTEVRSGPVVIYGRAAFSLCAHSDRDQLRLSFALPGWLFTDAGIVSFRFLGQCDVTYHNPRRLDTFADGREPRRIVLWPSEADSVEIEGGTIGAPYAEMIRNGEIGRVEVFF